MRLSERQLSIASLGFSAVGTASSLLSLMFFDRISEIATGLAQIVAVVSGFAAGYALRSFMVHRDLAAKERRIERLAADQREALDVLYASGFKEFSICGMAGYEAYEALRCKGLATRTDRPMGSGCSFELDEGARKVLDRSK